MCASARASTHAVTSAVAKIVLETCRHEATPAAHVVRVTIKRVPVHALPSTLSPVLAGRLTEGEMGVLFSDYDDKVAVKVRS